jgi:hypothetical protein
MHQGKVNNQTLVTNCARLQKKSKTRKRLILRVLRFKEVVPPVPQLYHIALYGLFVSLVNVAI